MKDFYKNNKAWITALIYVLIGVFFIIFKMGMLDILLRVVGILFIIQGVIALASKDYVSGIINTVIGLTIFIISFTNLIWYVLIIFGILLVIKGLIDLISSLSQKDFRTIATACVTIVLGILLILTQTALVSILAFLIDVVFIIIGVLFIIDGITALLGLNSKNKGKK